MIKNERKYLENLYKCICFLYAGVDISPLLDAGINMDGMNGEDMKRLEDFEELWSRLDGVKILEMVSLI